jgi:hypothetical protein
MKWILFAVVLVTLLGVGPSSPIGELCVGAHAALMAQGQHRPEPGNPGHLVPPDGWFCSTHDKDETKRCTCHRTDSDPLCEGTPTEDRPNCLNNCFPKHCHCDVECTAKK